MDQYDGTQGMTGGYSRGPSDMAAYNRRVNNMLDLNRALQLAYADGDPTQEQIAALGVSPEIWAEAQRQDKETSARKASGNFTSNMLPLAMIAAAYGVDLLGPAAGGGSAAGGSAAGSAATMGGTGSSFTAGGLLAPGPVTMGTEFLTPGMVSGGVAGAAAGAGAAGSDVLANMGLGSSGLLGGTTAGGVDAATLANMGLGGSEAGSSGLLGAASGGQGGAAAEINRQALTGMAGGAGGASASDAALAKLSDGTWIDTLSGGAKAAAQNTPGLLDALTSTKGLSTIAGALVGGLSSGDKTATQSSTHEPWGPAQDWIKRQIADGGKLQDYYQQNPFNAQQKVGMQNTLTDTDNFRNNILPGLLDFANGMMGGQYQRQRGGAAGSGAGYGGSMVPGGYAPGSGTVFRPAPGGQGFGQIDWDAVNPFHKHVP